MSTNIVGGERRFPDIVANNYTDLSTNFNPALYSGQYAEVINGQSGGWVPGWLGGTYYSKGFYKSNGTTWEYIGSFPYQATQIEVDAGVNDDKFVTPKTFIQGLTNWFTNSKLLSVLGYTPVPNTRTINGLDLSTNRVLTINNLGFFNIPFTPSSVVTGTTSETQVGVVAIPANSIKTTDQLRIYTPHIKSGTAGTVTIIYKLSTSSTMPSGTTDRIATFTSGSQQGWFPMQRNPVYNISNFIIQGASNNSLVDTAISVNTPSVIAYDRTQLLYLYVSVTLSNSADSVYLAGGYITNM